MTDNGQTSTAGPYRTQRSFIGEGPAVLDYAGRSTSVALTKNDDGSSDVGNVRLAPQRRHAIVGQARRPAPCCNAARPHSHAD
ncbi:MAG: hypothetical protein AAF668_16720 [Pseudomonadota bacterium]